MKANRFWSVLVMLMIALCATMSFSSCSSDSDGNSNPLIGTWVEEYTSYRIENTFLKNGVLRSTYMKEKNGKWEEEDIEEFDYILKGEYIIITTEYKTYTYEYTINGKKLYFWPVNDNNGEPLVLTKK